MEQILNETVEVPKKKGRRVRDPLSKTNNKEYYREYYNNTDLCKLFKCEHCGSMITKAKMLRHQSRAICKKKQAKL